MPKTHHARALRHDNRRAARTVAAPIKRKGVVFLRVSTKGQADGDEKLEVHLLPVRRYARNEGIEIVHVCTEILSGRLGLSERKDLQKGFDYFQRGEATEALLGGDLSRLTRGDMGKANEIFDALADLRVPIHLVPTGEVLRPWESGDEINLYRQWLAAREASRIIEARVRAHMHASHEMGRRCGGAIGLLFERVYHNPRAHLPKEKKLASIRPKPELVPVVREAVRRIADEDATWREITDYLASAGVRPKRAKELGRKTVEGILKSRLLIGLMTWEGEEMPGDWTPHFRLDDPRDRDLWDRFQVRLRARGKPSPMSRGKSRKRNQQERHPIAGLLRCGGCGRRLSGQRTRGRSRHYESYSCGNGRCRSRALVSPEFVRLRLRFEIAAMEPTRLADTLDAMWSAHRRDTAAVREMRAKIEAEIAAAEGESLATEMRAARSTVISDEAVKRVKAEFDERIAVLRGQLAVLAPPAEEPAYLADAKLILTEPLFIWDTGTDHDRAALVQLLFAQVTATRAPADAERSTRRRFTQITVTPRAIFRDTTGGVEARIAAVMRDEPLPGQCSPETEALIGWLGDLEAEMSTAVIDPADVQRRALAFADLCANDHPEMAEQARMVAAAIDPTAPVAPPDPAAVAEFLAETSNHRKRWQAEDLTEQCARLAAGPKKATSNPDAAENPEQRRALLMAIRGRKPPVGREVVPRGIEPLLPT